MKFYLLDEENVKIIKKSFEIFSNVTRGTRGSHFKSLESYDQGQRGDISLGSYLKDNDKAYRAFVFPSLLCSISCFMSIHVEAGVEIGNRDDKLGAIKEIKIQTKKNSDNLIKYWP